MFDFQHRSLDSLDMLSACVCVCLFDCLHALCLKVCFRESTEILKALSDLYYPVH